MNIIQALEAPFSPWFPGESWAAWKAVLRATFALPMTAEELITFGELAGGRKAPSGRVKELVVIAGRRSGKDSVASAVITWIAGIEQGHLGLLRPGERASVLLLACDRDQARIIRNYVGSYFQTIPELAEMVTGETKTGFELSNGVEVVIATNDFRAVRGRTILCAVMDEAAFYVSDEHAAAPDVETDRALQPALATLPASLKIIISSPYRRAGLLFEKWRDHFGKNDDDVLVIQAPSRVLNPTLPEKIVNDAIARDPAAARAEWLAEWRDDVASYLPREMIERAVDDGVLVRPPVPGLHYVAFADPSGGVSDSFTCGIAHAEGTKKGVISLDCLVEIRAPFSPAAATNQICSVLKEYGLSEVVGDKYAASWVVDAFATHNIRYVHSERDRSAVYQDALPLFSAGRARLLDDKRLVNQLAALERKTSVGRDRIGHPDRSGHHDDSANSACGALARAADRRGEGINVTDKFMHDFALQMRGVLPDLRAEWN